MLEVARDGAIATITLRGAEWQPARCRHMPVPSPTRGARSARMTRCAASSSPAMARPFAPGSDGELPVSLDPRRPRRLDAGCGRRQRPLALARGCASVGQGDIILAAEEAVFAGAPLDEGLPYEDLLYQRRRLPMPLAELLVFAGGAWTIDAARAYEVGWVSEVLPREGLLRRARELAETIAPQ
ncbi:MAG: hypothetical protein KatS3mg060_0790 [Dehalococcoidia bacterium]|nr:MAG: hypothetical protein KatS3mg060_0790 [Dehalococcoidia bacterium]